MWVKIAIIIVLLIILFFAFAFAKGVSLHKTKEEYWRDDLEQAEYLKQWNEAQSEKNKRDNELLKV